MNNRLIWTPVYIGLTFLLACSVARFCYNVVADFGYDSGPWPLLVLFGTLFSLLATGTFRRWRSGLLPYQCRRTEALHKQLGWLPPIWPPEIQTELDEIQASIDARAEAKRLKQEIKDKYSQPYPRVPPMKGSNQPLIYLPHQNAGAGPQRPGTH
jgi:hypothetical protein